jgi:hypothetical protein
MTQRRLILDFSNKGTPESNTVTEGLQKGRMLLFHNVKYISL